MSNLREEYTKMTGGTATPEGYEAQGAGFNREYVEWLEAKIDQSREQDNYLEKFGLDDDSKDSLVYASRLIHRPGFYGRIVVTPKQVEEPNEAK